MFALPDYWWLLALAALPQAGFALVLAISRGSRTSSSTADERGEAVVPVTTVVPKWAMIMLCIGAAIGIGYGIVQHDGVFILGQACVLVIALVRNRLLKRPTETPK